MLKEMPFMRGLPHLKITIIVYIKTIKKNYYPGVILIVPYISHYNYRQFQQVSKMIHTSTHFLFKSTELLKRKKKEKKVEFSSRVLTTLNFKTIFVEDLKKTTKKPTIPCSGLHPQFTQVKKKFFYERKPIKCT